MWRRRGAGAAAYMCSKTRERRGGVVNFKLMNNSSKSELLHFRFHHDSLAIFFLAHTSTYPIPLNLISMPCTPAPCTPAPQRQIMTRSSNKTAHPGYVDKVEKTRRTTEEVQKDRKAKAQAKATREAAREKSINRTAEFEVADKTREYLADATPRAHPPFTPKQRLQSHNQAFSDLTPLKATSDSEVDTNFDRASFVPDRSETSAQGDDSAAESDAPTIPPPKHTSQSIGKAAVRAVTTKTTKGGKKRANEPDVEVIPSDTEPLQVPKAKKKKLRDEINIAVKNMGGDKYSNMVEVISQGGRSDGPNGEPAFKAMGVKKRKTAVAASFDHETNSDQTSKQNKDGNNET